MNMKNVGLLIAICIFVNTGLFAQYTEDDGGIESKNEYLRYIGIGAGATYQLMNDAAISPIEYSRIRALPMYSHMKVNQVTYTELAIRASQVNLIQKQDPEKSAKVKTQRALMDYRLAFKMPVELRNYDIKAGLLLSGYFGNRNAPHLLDAAKVYEYAASLGLCGRITKEVTFAGHTAFLAWDIGLPVLANVSRPHYLNRENRADPEAKIIGDFLGNSATGSFGTFFRLDSRLALMYRLENGNIIQFAYEWDYTKIKTINKAFFVEHIASVIFMFNY